MTVIHAGERDHVCAPGWEKRWHEHDPDAYLPLPSGWYFHQLDLAPGSVVQCECGQVWVAVAMGPGEHPGLLVHRIRWRKPTWRERRRWRT